MSTETHFVQIDLTPEYKRNLRDISKKYRNIRLDTQSVIVQLQEGNFIGDRVRGMGENYLILKVRVKNSNIQKGKSAGYRLREHLTFAKKIVVGAEISLEIGLGNETFVLRTGYVNALPIYL